MIIYFVLLFLLTFAFNVQGQEERLTQSKRCPRIKPICDCIPQYTCSKDKECPENQLCCNDCCGGRTCMPPDQTNKCTKLHQIYKDCGTACPPTCENPAPELCTEQCVAGCFCEDGFLLRKDGECVLKEDC